MPICAEGICVVAFSSKPVSKCTIVNIPIWAARESREKNDEMPTVTNINILLDG